jgi:hypothetical protein
MQHSIVQGKPLIAAGIYTPLGMQQASLINRAVPSIRAHFFLKAFSHPIFLKQPSQVTKIRTQDVIFHPAR